VIIINQDNPTPDGGELDPAGQVPQPTNQPSSGQGGTNVPQDAPGEGGEPGGQTPSQTDDGGDGKPDRSAQSRINQLAAEKKALEEKLRNYEGGDDRRVPMPYSRPREMSLEEQKAASTIGRLGFATRDEIQEMLTAQRNRTIIDMEHQRLSQAYDGSDGRPSYERDAVEQFMRDKGMYNPEDAYKLMNQTELTEWAIKQATSKQKEQPHSAPPSVPSSSKGEDGAYTREKIAEMRAKDPVGFKKWWEENRDNVFSLMSEGKLE